MSREELEFNANKLRTPIKEGKNAQQIMDAFDIKKPMLKFYVVRLIQLGEQFFKVAGMGERAVGGGSKFGKNGIHLSAALLKTYGFSQGVLNLKSRVWKRGRLCWRRSSYLAGISDSCA